MPIVTGCLCRLPSYFGKLRKFCKLFLVSGAFYMEGGKGLEKIFLRFFSVSLFQFLKNIAAFHKNEAAAVHANLRQCCHETESIVK